MDSTLVIFTILFFANILISYILYEDKSYKTAIFSAFAAGVCLGNISHYLWTSTRRRQNSL